MRAFGIEVDHRYIRELYDEYDKDLETEGFNFDEFQEVMAARLEERNSKKEIKRLFNLLDHHNTGLLTFDGLKQIAEEIQEKITDDDLAELIGEADYDKDGALSFQEFYKYLIFLF